MSNKTFLLVVIYLTTTLTVKAQQWFIPGQMSQDSLILGDLDWGDYDGDGDQDLLLIGMDPNSHLHAFLYNNTNGNFTAVNTPFVGVQNGTCNFIDFDNDNDLDVLISGTDNSGSLVTETYENVNGVYQPIDLGIKDAMFTSTVWIDVDHDGDQDLFLSGWDASYTGTTLLYMNHMDTFIVDTNIAFPTVSFAALDATDLDHDGNTDIILSGQDANYVEFTQIFEYDTSSSSLVSQSYSLEPLSSPWAVFFDYDEDGDDDLFHLGVDPNYEKRFIVYENTGTSLVQRQSIDSLSSGTSKSPFVVGDIDNDGDPDVILAGYDDNYVYQMHIYENVQDSFIYRSQSGLPLFGGNSSLAFYDIDNDLDLDFAYEGYDDLTIDPLPIQLFVNDSATTNTAPLPPTLTNDLVTNKDVKLSWNSGSDQETQTSGLTYNLNLYNVSLDSFVVSPNSDSSGNRMVTRRGNMLQDTSVTYKELSPGKYYWQIQSIDNSFVESTFSTQDSFLISDLYAFNLELPANAATISIEPTSDTLSFSWFSSDNALSYKFYLMNNTGNELLNSSTGSDTTYSISHIDLYDLVFNAGQQVSTTESYSWYVKAYGQYDSLISIDTFSFNLELLRYPKDFNLKTPVDGHNLSIEPVMDSLRFNWFASESDIDYRLFLMNNSGTQISSFSAGQDTSHSVSHIDLYDLAFNSGHQISTTESYNWYVKAYGQYDSLISIDTFNFNLELRPYPTNFDLLTPENTDTVVLDINGSGTLNFSWNKSRGVTDYNFDLVEGLNGNFNQTSILNANTLDTIIAIGEDQLADDLIAAGHSLNSVRGYSWRTEATGSYQNTLSNQVNQIYFKLIDSAVGVEEIDNTSISCSPVPFTNELNIRVTGINPVKELTVYNLLGIPMVQIDDINHSFNISTENWPSGTYVLSYQVGSKVETIQIVKH